MRRDVATDPAVPVIVRLAGLPAEVMEPLGSERCVRGATELARLESELESIRAQIVDRLHEKVHGAPAEVRRALLAVKRDCHNGRDLTTRRSSSAWAIFEQAAPDLAQRIGELEAGVAAERAAFEAAFDAEHERQVRHLLACLEDDNLHQGLALGSPEVLGNVDRLRQPCASYRRKERRLVESVARYVSRAALKLSPFSTLTRLGLGSVLEAADGAPVELELRGATHRELRRIRKHVVVKYSTLLRQHPVFRDRLHVQVNPSVECVAPGRYRFIQAFHWQFNQQAGEFHYCNESQVSASLRGPLIEELQALLEVSRPHGEVVQGLARKLGADPAAVEAVIRKLLDLGFLLLFFPWPSNDFDPERTLLAFLGELPRDPALDEFARLLERLLELRDGRHPSHARPQAYRAIDELRLEGFAVLTSALELPEAKEAPGKHLYEDVFVLPQADRHQDAVAHISRQSAERALASAHPVVLFSDLNYTRYELLHSLAALAEKHWPGQQEVGFLDLFHLAQPLWGEYVTAASAAITEWRQELWNPYGLAEISALNRLRETVLTEMEGCMRPEGDELVLDLESAERSVRRIPDTYVPAFGPCLFVQPATPRGDLWMLNHLLDGTGRFSNRYTTVMPPGMRERYSSHLGEGGAGATLLGEPAEMIEILSARDDHLNVHRVQTARVLELPGENPDLPPERRLGVRELRVRLDGPLPVLVDLRGQRLLPVFLGTNGLVGMPTLVRFLSRFGIGEFRLMHPPRYPQRRGGVVSYRRLRIGNLVLRRKMWVFSPAATFGAYAESSDAELFLAVHRWRLEHGIPERVFAAEKLETKFDLWPRHKPQYLDFTSPAFVHVLRSVLRSTPAELKLEELLPDPEAFPADEDGRRWAFEAQLDSIAFHPIRPWKQRHAPFQAPRGRLRIPERADSRQPSHWLTEGGRDV